MPEVKGFKYVYSAKQIEDVLKKVQDTGRPDKLTVNYLKSTWLLKNAQYGAVIDLLKAMNFINANGTPLELYAEYQNHKNSKKALAKGILNAYRILFKAYPKANVMSNDDLRGYFKQQTGAEKSVVDKIMGTFNKLCKMADFDHISSQTTTTETQDDTTKVTTQVTLPQNNLIPITMNIQLVLPSDATAEQYDKIFTSLKKLLKN